LALTNFRKRLKWLFIGARNYVQVFFRYKNWNEILSKTYKKQTVTKVILRNGIEINAPGKHPILLTMVNETFFDKIHTLSDISIKENAAVIDIGANIGIVSIFAALKTKNKVYAFEPSPENFKFLKTNVAINQLDNIVPYQVAVCDKTQKSMKLYMEHSVGNSLLSEECNSGKYVEVPSITLQDIIDNIVCGEVDFLKMDCEGSEGLIFSSTPMEYLRKIKEMEVEFHDKSSLLKHEELQKLMEKAGFEVKLYWPFGKNKAYGAIHAKRLNINAYDQAKHSYHREPLSSQIGIL
jgi:FkbM family methyltransferase